MSPRKPSIRARNILSETIRSCVEGGSVIGIIAGWPIGRTAADVRVTVGELAAELLEEFNTLPACKREEVFGRILYAATREARRHGGWEALADEAERKERHRKKRSGGAQS